MRWSSCPTLGAESLRSVHEPGASLLTAGPRLAPSDVARAMVAALSAEAAPDAAPDFLRLSQHRAFRRVLAAIRRHRGALLAEPVGSGKTWIALAVAHTLQGDRVTPVIAPAALRTHWERTARLVGVPIRFASTSAASRGRLPPIDSFAILDESHHFRTRRTERYRHAARWLTGKCALLLSATPVVNRLDDLSAQLRLVVRDDALAASGVGSLDVLLASGQGDAALADLIVASPSGVRAPHVRHALEPPDPDPLLLDGLDALQLSRDVSVASLVRQVLCRALASSPAAFIESLTTYQRLLDHAADAAVSGRRIDRDLIRQFAGPDASQCVMWEMVAEEGAPELLLSDRSLLHPLLVSARKAEADDDAKVTLLRTLLEDGQPTLVFTTRRPTVRYLRDRLLDLWPAWCSGTSAGLGVMLAPRSQVLDWFRRDAPAGARLPTLLVATDVAAEGLDLSRLTRVVHYDLPWTPARLEQREGRSRRGPDRELVTAWSMRLPRALAARLDLEGLLESKRRLPSVIDLGDDASLLWRWREALAATWGDEHAWRPGCAALEWDRAAVLAVLQVLQHTADGDQVAGRAALLIEASGEATADPATITDILARAMQQPDTAPAPAEADERRAAMALVAPQARNLLRRHEAAAWWRRSTGSQRLVTRLASLARRARLERDNARLRELEHALLAAGGGHSAGEEALVRDLERLDDGALAREAGRLPSGGEPAALLSARVAGLLILRARSLPFPASGATFAAHDNGHPALRP